MLFDGNGPSFSAQIQFYPQVSIRLHLPPLARYAQTYWTNTHLGGPWGTVKCGGRVGELGGGKIYTDDQFACLAYAKEIDFQLYEII